MEQPLDRADFILAEAPQVGAMLPSEELDVLMGGADLVAIRN